MFQSGNCWKLSSGVIRHLPEVAFCIKMYMAKTCRNKIKRVMNIQQIYCHLSYKSFFLKTSRNVGQTGFYWLGFKGHLTQPKNKNNCVTTWFNLLPQGRINWHGVLLLTQSHGSLKNILMWDLILAAVAAAHNNTLVFLFCSCFCELSASESWSRSPVSTLPFIFIDMVSWWKFLFFYNYFF